MKDGKMVKSNFFYNRQCKMGKNNFFYGSFLSGFFCGGFLCRRIRSCPRRQPHFTIITALGCFDFGSATIFSFLIEPLTDPLMCGVSLSNLNWVPIANGALGIVPFI